MSSQSPSLLTENGSMLGIEVNAGSDMGESDFSHLAWFRGNMARDSAFTGIVLYTGATVICRDLRGASAAFFDIMSPKRDNGAAL